MIRRLNDRPNPFFCQVRSAAALALSSILEDSPLSKWVGPLEPHVFPMNLLVPTDSVGPIAPASSTGRPVIPSSLSLAWSLSRVAQCFWAPPSHSDVVLESKVAGTHRQGPSTPPRSSKLDLTLSASEHTHSPTSTPTMGASVTSSTSASSSLSHRIVGTLQSLFLTVLWAIERATLHAGIMGSQTSTKDASGTVSLTGAECRHLATLAKCLATLVSHTPQSQLAGAPTFLAYYVEAAHWTGTH